jgi:hypothetical protein
MRVKDIRYRTLLNCRFHLNQDRLCKSELKKGFLYLSNQAANNPSFAWRGYMLAWISVCICVCDSMR